MGSQYSGIKHLAIIPDGNRRWAKAQGWTLRKGYRHAGDFERLRKIYKECEGLRINTLSIWAFSTENWNRSGEEKKIVFETISEGLDSMKKKADEDGLRFMHIGRKDRLPGYLTKKIKNLENATKDNKKIVFVVGIDYGGNDEILRAVNRAIKSKKKNINGKDFRNFLDTKEIPDPDLIIRTSGEKRLSGYMPFQSSYAELFFLKKNFPELSTGDIKKVVSEFNRRKRRFGN